MVERANGRDRLWRPHPGERGYPDVAGLGIFLYPNWHSRSRLDIRFKKVVEQAGELRLVGRAANGLRVAQRIRLVGHARGSEPRR